MSRAHVLVFTAFLSACGSAPPQPPSSELPAPQEARVAARSQPQQVLVAPVVARPVTVDRTCAAALVCAGESCCEKLEVPGGVYRDRRAGEVRVSTFRLDKYELTVGRVRAWSDAGEPTPPDGAVIGRDSRGEPVRWRGDWRVLSGDKLRGWARYDTWTAGDAALPKNFIDWYTSAAVCHYAGGRLPTDAEWRYAAVGGDEDRPYPWGSEPQDATRAVYNCTGDGDPSCTLADILPVGSRPSGVGRWGHMDLAGSMFEWTADAGGSDEVVSRGGGFCYIGGVDRRSRHVGSVANERRDEPTSTSHMVGARCAFDVEEGERAVAAR